MSLQPISCVQWQKQPMRTVKKWKSSRHVSCWQVYQPVWRIGTFVDRPTDRQTDRHSHRHTGTQSAVYIWNIEIVRKTEDDWNCGWARSTAGIDQTWSLWKLDAPWAAHLVRAAWCRNPVWTWWRFVRWWGCLDMPGYACKPGSQFERNDAVGFWFPPFQWRKLHISQFNIYVCFCVWICLQSVDLQHPVLMTARIQGQLRVSQLEDRFLTRQSMCRKSDTSMAQVGWLGELYMTQATVCWLFRRCTEILSI